MDANEFKAIIDAELSHIMTPLSIDCWWSAERGRLGCLSLTTLLELGAYETIKLELFRLTGALRIGTLSDGIADQVGCLPVAALRRVRQDSTR